MSASIDQAFIKQYQAEVQEAYQRQGSKLRPTVRSKTEVRGASTIFQKVGVGTAAAKARNGVVPVMNIDHSAVGWKQWSELLTIQEFANAQYIGDGELPWKGTQAKRWLGATWIPHSGLTKNGSLRYCYFYHKTAIGHASGYEITTDITWHG